MIRYRLSRIRTMLWIVSWLRKTAAIPQIIRVIYQAGSSSDTGMPGRGGPVQWTVTWTVVDTQTDKRVANQGGLARGLGPGLMKLSSVPGYVTNMGWIDRDGASLNGVQHKIDWLL